MSYCLVFLLWVSLWVVADLGIWTIVDPSRPFLLVKKACSVYLYRWYQMFVQRCKAWTLSEMLHLSSSFSPLKLVLCRWGPSSCWDIFRFQWYTVCFWCVVLLLNSIDVSLPVSTSTPVPLAGTRQPGASHPRLWLSRPDKKVRASYMFHWEL